MGGKWKARAGKVGMAEREARERALREGWRVIREQEGESAGALRTARRSLRAFREVCAVFVSSRLQTVSRHATVFTESAPLVLTFVSFEIAEDRRGWKRRRKIGSSSAVCKFHPLRVSQFVP